MLKHLLVAVDFGEPSKAALEYAIDFAKALGAKITVVHVYEVPSFGYEGGLVSMPIEMATSIRDGAITATKQLCDSYASRGVTLASVVREGVPWHVIESVAAEVSADLIVVGTHGRRGLSHALLGSIAEKVIRTATRPVLTFRMAKKS